MANKTWAVYLESSRMGKAVLFSARGNLRVCIEMQPNSVSPMLAWAGCNMHGVCCSSERQVEPLFYCGSCDKAKG